MNTQLELGEMPCGTDPLHGSTDENPCAPCLPKMALTYEEEAILAEMREIKAHVRPVAQRMKELQKRMESTSDGEEARGAHEEWERLSGELNHFRTLWDEWEAKLEQAIEDKLIFLGHREPRT